MMSDLNCKNYTNFREIVQKIFQPLRIHGIGFMKILLTQKYMPTYFLRNIQRQHALLGCCLSIHICNLESSDEFPCKFYITTIKLGRFLANYFFTIEISVWDFVV